MAIKKRSKKKSIWYIYILESQDGRLYTGITTDIQRRMKEHASGRGARFTRIFGFKKLLYQEEALSRPEAMKREAEIKTWPAEKKRLLTEKRKEK